MIYISVCSGTYNRLQSVKGMVESVRRNLPPGFGYEIILADGGSTDGTLEWAKEQKDIRLLEIGELTGAIHAFNLCFANAVGEYVLIANDDIEFLPDSILRAFSYMENNPEVGIGGFESDRANRGWHVAEMPARMPDEHPVNVYYGQVCLVPRWLGDRLSWWTLPGARTYGGDNALSARAYEAGYPVRPIPGARVHDMATALQDELRKINNTPVPPGENHPDTQAYLNVWPKGPKLTEVQAFPNERKGRAFRILYAPIFEPGHPVQRAQKRGLREALAEIGAVCEVDYVHGGDILAAAQLFQPDLVLTQLHDAEHFKVPQARRLRALLRGGFWVNWHGDVWPGAFSNPDYLEILRHCNLATLINGSLLPGLLNAGINALYWQIGYEPDGVSVEPDETTPKHDIVFLANAYSPERKQLGAFLRSLPYNVGLYGRDWPEANGQTTYDFRIGCQLYRNAKIAISDSQWPDADGFVSNRLFQALAAGGAVVLQQYFRGLDDRLGFISPDDLVVWRNERELATAIDLLMEDDRTRRTIAASGQLKALHSHSFRARVSELLRILHDQRAHAGPHR